ncbi:TolC family protein [bacterium]|nr:TolC family protein [bacterium]
MASPILRETAPIDLATVLALAGEKPNAVRLARERLAEAEAKKDEALSRLLPTIAVGAVFGRHNGTIQDTQGNFIDEVTRQRVFLGGVGDLGIDVGNGIYGSLAAKRRAEAATEEVEAVVQARVLDAVYAYFDLVEAQAAMAIARDSFEHATAFHDLTTARERRALGLRVDTLRAEADVASARHAQIAAERRFRTASVRLAAMLRLEPTTTLFTVEKDVRPVTFVASETPLETLIATALENRPDLRAQRRRTEAAGLDDDAARIGPLIPSFHAGVGTPAGAPLGSNGGLGYDGHDFGKLDGREDYYVGLQWRLNGLGLGDAARARATGARLRAELVRDDDSRERAIQEVIEASEDVRATHAAIDAAERELRAADEVRKIAKKRLEEGTGLAIEVLSAEETRTRAATRLVEAITGYNRAQYRLLVRLGERPAR